MSTFLSASWLNLVFANYHVEKELLEKYLPSGTELDSFNGITYISLVGFLFTDTKLKGFIIPCHQTFEEINFRFYVRRKINSTWRRGVVFIKEIVPKPMVTLIANRVYYEKYETLQTRHSWSLSSELKSIHYEWLSRGIWNGIKVNRGENMGSIAEGSEEEFLTKHHWGYTRIDNARTIEYEVKHPDWNLYKVLDYEVNCNFADVYGHEFDGLSSVKPMSILAVDGSAITISNKQTITAVNSR